MTPSLIPRRALVAGLMFLALATVGACGSDSDPAGQAWLHGTWVLTFNPDRDSRDDLVFRDNGGVEVHTEDNRVVNGIYRIRDDQLVLLLEIKDQVVDVNFDIAPDKSRLTYKNGAYYTRQAPMP